MIKKIITYAAAFIITILLGILILYGSAMIPKKNIENNFRRSAGYLCEKNVFFLALDKVQASKIDRYADSILLNIAWHLEDNLSSIMMDSYYYTRYQNENINLLDTLIDGKEANLQYMRYWHGSAAIVRLLHLILSIKWIYRLHAVLLVILTILLIVSLVRRKMIPESAALVTGLIFMSVWFVPMSLEYTWTFILMLAASIIAVFFEDKGNATALELVFLVSGMVTNYLDFLTTETITLLVPLLIICRLRMQKGEIPVTWKWFLKMIVLWGFGYAGMWLMKWLLAAVITGDNVMPYITGHIEERLNGKINNISSAKYILLTIRRNISCLFPMAYGAAGKISSIVLVFFVLYLTYVYRKKKIDKKAFPYMLIIGLVPYVRYVVLHNHAFLHFFFTYRAQLASVMVVSLMVIDIVDWRYIENAIFHRRKA